MKRKEMLKLINKIDDEYIERANELLERHNGISSSEFIHVSAKKNSSFKQMAAVFACGFAVLAGTAAIAFTIGKTDAPDIGKNSGVYVPIDSDYDNSQAENDKIICEIKPDSGYDGSNYTILNSSYTLNGDYLYLFQNGGMTEDGALIRSRLNLTNGELQPLCNTPACTHDTPDCIYQTNMVCARGNGNEILYLSGNKLMSYQNGEHKVLFTNNYITELDESEKTTEDDGITSAMQEAEKRGITGYVIGEEYIYMFGGNIVFKVDKNNYSAGNPITAGENQILSLCLYYDLAFVTNDVNELYMIDFNAGKVEKICDKAVNPVFSDNKLYYIKWDNSVPSLYCRDKFFDNEKKILEDCYVNFVIKDGYVYYSQFVNDKKMYVYSISENKKTLLLNAELPHIITFPNIDRVFAITESDISSWKTDGSDYVRLETAEVG